MNKKEYLLTSIAEECNEVGQRCSKALRFGSSEAQEGQDLTNEERIIQEFNDLVAVMEMYFGGPITRHIEDHQVAAKKEKVEKYMEYARSCGTLKDE